MSPAPNKFQIIGDTIYFEGYVVGCLTAPVSAIRDSFETLLDDRAAELYEDRVIELEGTVEELEYKIYETEQEKDTEYNALQDKLYEAEEEIFDLKRGKLFKYFRESFEVMLDNWE